MEQMADWCGSEERLAVGIRVTPPSNSGLSSRQTITLPKRLSKLSELMMCKDVEMAVNHETIDIGRSKFMFFIPGSRSSSRRESRRVERNCSQSSLATGSMGGWQQRQQKESRESSKSRISALRLPRNDGRITSAQQQQSNRLRPATHELGRYTSTEDNCHFPMIEAAAKAMWQPTDKSTFKRQPVASTRASEITKKTGPMKNSNERRSEEVSAGIFKTKYAKNGSKEVRIPQISIRSKVEMGSTAKDDGRLNQGKWLAVPQPEYKTAEDLPNTENTGEFEMISTILPMAAHESQLNSAELTEQSRPTVIEQSLPNQPQPLTKAMPTPKPEPIHNPSSATKCKGAAPLISPYDDLFLSDDAREMSSLVYLGDEGTYYSSMASYEEKPLVDQLAATEPTKEHRDAMIETEAHDPQRASQVAAPVLRDDSNYDLLKSQIQETQLALSKLMEQSASRISPEMAQPPQISPVVPTKAPILQHAHVSESLANLYWSLRQSTTAFQDEQFQISRQTTGNQYAMGVPIQDLPRTSEKTPVIFYENIGLVCTNNPATKNLCTVLNILALNNPQMITRLFEGPACSLAGRPMLCVWLNVDGQFNPIVIDAYLPYDSQSLEPLSCFSEKDGQVWPQLIEKALAKSLQGYQHIRSLSYEQLLHIITGMHTHNIVMSKPDFAWKSLLSAMDNGCFIFAEDEDKLVYVEDCLERKGKSLQVRIDHRLETIPFQQFCRSYQRVLITNLSTNYHYNYHQLELSSNKTISMQLHSHCRAHVYLCLQHNGLTVEQSSNSSLSMCVYRVQEELLKLVVERSSQSQAGLWVELVLKKGLYKIFLSSSPLRLTAIDPANLHTAGQPEADKTERTTNNLNLMLTVTSKDNIRCAETVDTLRKHGDSKLANQSISYQAVKASSFQTQQQGLSGLSKPPPKKSSKHPLQKSINQPPKVPPRQHPTFLTSRNCHDTQ